MSPFENINSSPTDDGRRPEKPEQTEKQKKEGKENPPAKTYEIDEEIEQATNKIDEDIEKQERAGIPDEEISTSAETNIQQIKNKDEKLINKALERDVLFYNELNEKWEHGMTAPETINQIQNNYETRIQDEFKLLSSEKQDFLVKFLGNRLGELSKQIEETQNKLQDKTIDKSSKQQLENSLKDLKNQQKAVQARTQAYHLTLRPKEQPEGKEESPDKQLEKILKEIGEGNITPDKFLKFISTPGAGETISKILNGPEFQEGIKKTENQDKLKKIIKKLEKFKNTGKEGSQSETVIKFIKNEKEKGKRSFFQEIGGWRTTGEVAGFSLMISLIIILLGEFKLLEKVTGVKMESGGKKK